jgi:hypothetical protein
MRFAGIDIDSRTIELVLDRMKTMDWLYRLCRWTLGGVFIFAGSTKLLEPEIFAVRRKEDAYV